MDGAVFQPGPPPAILVIGPVDRITARAARTRARAILAEVTLGNDPHAAKTNERRAAGFTLLAVANEYLEARKPHLRPSSYRVTALYLTGRAYFGSLHGTAITDIGLSDVASRLNAIARKSGNVTASRARAALHAMFTWCATQGLLGEHPTNPVTATHVQSSASRDRVLTDAELIEIWRACDEGGDNNRIIRLLMLTAARRSEIGGLTWDELDMATGTWTLPKERSKNKHAHTLVLPPLALHIIADVPRRMDRPQLFGDRAHGGFAGWQDAKHKLDERLAGQIQPWQLRDIRRSVATRMCDIGIQPHIVEEILNHRSGHRSGVASVYNRSAYAAEVKTALLRWADHIRTLIEGGERKIFRVRAARGGQAVKNMLRTRERVWHNVDH